VVEVQVRILNGEDYRDLVEIVNLVEAPWQTCEEELHKEDSEVSEAGGTVYHYVAVEGEQGRVIGHGVLRGREGRHILQQYSLELRIHPDWERHGAGALLWQRLQEDLKMLQPTSVRVWVRERYPQALGFAGRRDFVEISRSGPWVLSVAEADLNPFLPALERCASSGITLTTLTEERERAPHCLSALHRLRIAIDADIPAAEPYPIVSLEDFAREVENAWADGFFIAKRGDDYIGLSCLSHSPVDPQELHQSVTGVRGDYRNHGIATALKVRGIQLAQARGCAKIVTYVDSTNIPMTALNRKLGFSGGNDAVLMERQYRTA